LGVALVAIALQETQQWLKTVTWRELANWITQLSQSPELKEGNDMLETHANNVQNRKGTIDLDKPTEYSHHFVVANLQLNLDQQRPQFGHSSVGRH
jgi:hypothetical protein